MQVLWVATKSPVPPVDGGRVVTLQTLTAMARIGIQGVLVAPTTGTIPLDIPGWRSIGISPTPRWERLRRWQGRGSFSVGQHSHPGVRDAVARLLQTEQFDVVHAEQLYAWPQCAGSPAPVVLRSQNVEQDVLASRSPGRFAGALRAVEHRRLAEFEGHAIRAATAAVALTRADAQRLAVVAGPTARIHHVPAPFPAELSPGARLPGDPAVVLFGSRGWFPNRLGAAWFRTQVWPVLRRALPGAWLHVIGLPGPPDPGERLTVHPPPAASRDAFPANGIIVVPSQTATGLRMKVLEAWARGVLVVATSTAATGLVLDDAPISISDDPPAFAAAIARLHRDAAFADRQRQAGRSVLRRIHDPETVASQLAAVYQDALAAVTPRVPTDPRPPVRAATLPALPPTPAHEA